MYRMKIHDSPAITMSYLIAGLACALAALCYAEFACDYPVSFYACAKIVHTGSLLKYD